MVNCHRATEAQRGASHRLLLFDIDGTLILTGGAGVRAMNRAFAAAFGRDEGFRGIPMAGRTDQAILLEALTRAELAHDRRGLSEFWRRYQQFLEEEIERPGPRKGVMPGVRELLDTLAARDEMFSALLTGNFAEAARIKLEHFDLWRYFRCGAFGDDAVERHDLVSVAVARAQACGVPPVDPAQVWVVGDTPLDIACATRARAHALAVATGDYDVESLKSSGAEIVFEDLRDTAAFMAAIEDANPRAGRF